MKDGNVRVLEGPVAEDREDYVITLPLGPVREPKARVEAVFGSLREAYEYQRDHLPDRDPDEHLRLARWCLTFGMEAEAAEQLKALLAWSPGDPTAEAMLKSLAASAASKAARDSEVVRTGADAAGLMGGARSPRDPADSALGRIRAYKGPVAAPRIFDLPEPLAVRRFQEFGETVHRVLQARCARCHDELSDRNFRLVRARDQKDLRNALLIRTNLDATLALVDREAPEHSPLLINAVMPHGPDQRPILTNPNSQEYRLLWDWIESLRGDAIAAPAPAIAAPAPAPMVAPAPGGYPAAAAAPAPARMAPGSPAFGGGFAAQRSGPVATAPAQPSPTPFVPNPYAINEQIRMDAVHPSVPADLDFQTVSPLLGSPEAATLTIDGRPVRPPGATAPAPASAPGSIPTLPGAVPMPGVPGTAPAPRPAPSAGAAPEPGSPALPPEGAPGASAVAPRPAGTATPVSGQPGVVQLPDGTQILTQADGSKVMRLPTGEMLPYLDKAAVDQTARSDGDGRGLQIDPALLEKLQRRRNGGR
ncbi:hypothetical protein TsocGM_11885 [Tautonia sociabilis]|uniref:Cytochrome c domain-containing protein n=2 Tax=Tautonia sociabilis TaxID=2080755 RepID=A0A432MJU6_9BACT|nr:hypothetical protein TsocGM_11885 [Tautonia sociabilis]